jgi:hypothetical protein
MHWKNIAPVPFLRMRSAPRWIMTELTRNKKVDPDTFARMSRYYSERQICEIVWLVATEHVYNMTNIGLNIHSDMLCDIGKKKQVEESEKVLQS